VTGWIDWNMALDLEGGPNWASNFVDAPVIVNATADEFYKQPMFYTMAHFSKFLLPDSVVLDHVVVTDDRAVEMVVVQRPDNSYASVVLNR
jgi:glucosylceramidase